VILRKAVEIIQTDTRSYFASCLACGAGATVETRRKAKLWAATHKKGRCGDVRAANEWNKERTENVGTQR